MAVVIAPFATAAIIFFLGVAAIWVFQTAGHETDELEIKMALRLLIVPFCFAVLVLVVDGISNHLYLVRWLKP